MPRPDTEVWTLEARKKYAKDQQLKIEAASYPNMEGHDRQAIQENLAGLASGLTQEEIWEQSRESARALFGEE